MTEEQKLLIDALNKAFKNGETYIVITKGMSSVSWTAIDKLTFLYDGIFQSIKSLNPSTAIKMLHTCTEVIINKLFTTHWIDEQDNPTDTI